MLIKKCPKCDYRNTNVVVVKDRYPGLFVDEERYRVMCTHCNHTTDQCRTQECAEQEWNYAVKTKFNLSPSYILFDFETTGLKLPEAKPVQLAYIVLSQEFIPLVAKNFYFQVEEEVPEQAAKVHGLTKSKLVELGAGTIEGYHEEIQRDFNSRGVLCIAHNVRYDIQFLMENFLEKRPRLFCTMDYYTDIIKLPGKFDKYKWPRVSETIEYLGVSEKTTLQECNQYYGAQNIGFHDARFDIACIYEMIKKDGLLRSKLQEAWQ